MSGDVNEDVANAIIGVGASSPNRMMGALLSTLLLSTVVLGIAMNTNSNSDNSVIEQQEEENEWR